MQGYDGWTLLVRDVSTCTPQPGLVLGAVPFMPTRSRFEVLGEDETAFYVRIE